MAQAITKNFQSPDEVQPMENGQADVVDLGELKAVRLTLKPGWRWSQSVKPMVHTDSCQVHHIGYAAAGRLMIRLDDGTEFEVDEGDVYDIPPGHDAWVVGNEPAVWVDFRSVESPVPSAH